MVFSRNELMGACNALNEVLNGLPETGAVADFFAEESVPPELPRRLSTAYETQISPVEVPLSGEESRILRRVIDVVLQEIEDPELQTRLGLFRHEMIALRSRLP